MNPWYNLCTDDSAFEDNQVKLTTFKRLEESVIEDQGGAVESTLNNDDADKIPQPEVVDAIAALEKHDSLPDFTVHLHTEK